MVPGPLFCPSRRLLGRLGQHQIDHQRPVVTRGEIGPARDKGPPQVFFERFGQQDMVDHRIDILAVGRSVFVAIPVGGHAVFRPLDVSGHVDQLVTLPLRVIIFECPQDLCLGTSQRVPVGDFGIVVVQVPSTTGW